MLLKLTNKKEQMQTSEHDKGSTHEKVLKSRDSNKHLHKLFLLQEFGKIMDIVE